MVNLDKRKIPVSKITFPMDLESKILSLGQDYMIPFMTALHRALTTHVNKPACGTVATRFRCGGNYELVTDCTASETIVREV